eukprot:gene11543-14138_t
MARKITLLFVLLFVVYTFAQSVPPPGTVPLVANAFVNVRTSSDFNMEHKNYVLFTKNDPNAINPHPEGWAANSNDQKQFIMIGSDVPKYVTHVATQGRGDFVPNQWVTSYKLRYTVDGITWLDYNGGAPISANFDRDTVVLYAFPSPLLCRGLALHPLTWNTHISLRFEVYALPLSPLSSNQNGITGQPANDPNNPLATGTGPRVSYKTVTFPVPFKTVPKVSIALSQVEAYDISEIESYSVEAINVSTTGFVAAFRTWGNTKVYSVYANWLAYENF